MGFASKTHLRFSEVRAGGFLINIVEFDILSKRTGTVLERLLKEFTVFDNNGNGKVGLLN